jgi:hypothetical protein
LQGHQSLRDSHKTDGVFATTVAFESLETSYGIGERAWVGGCVWWLVIWGVCGGWLYGVCVVVGYMGCVVCGWLYDAQWKVMHRAVLIGGQTNLGALLNTTQNMRRFYL